MNKSINTAYPEYEKVSHDVNISVPTLSTIFLYQKNDGIGIEFSKTFLHLLIQFLLIGQFWHYHNLKHMVRN